MQKKRSAHLPEWFDSEHIDTVIFAFPDMHGRLLGKRMTYDHFVKHGLSDGMHSCNYLMTTDIELNILDGFQIASWEQGYGDFLIKADLRTLRHLAWLDGTAIVIGDMFKASGEPVEPTPRRILARQIERLAECKQVAYLGSELEFFLFDESYRSARQKNYRNLVPASDYAIDYHILQPSENENVLRRLRNEMSDTGIGVECSKGETGHGQHEVNLVYAESMEMADRHVLYKFGAKQIASQHGKAISFIAKLDGAQAGNGFHIHTSLWDAEKETNLFWDAGKKKPSGLFRCFLGGLVKYSRELAYFFAPTVNSYKRYQPGSWAPTAIVCGHDNRTCGYRVVGADNSLRIENRMPCADANPYLAFAATLAAGLQGIEERIEADDSYRGNAYLDNNLPHLPLSLEQAVELLDRSELARQAFGTEVVDFYVKHGNHEVNAFNQAVTDWELRRYFEQL